MPIARPATLSASKLVCDRYALLITLLFCVPIGALSTVSNPLFRRLHREKNQ